MTKDRPVRREERPSQEPDLLWDCFTNWADVLHEIEVRKKDGAQPRGGSES
jgi:hypothetical protein